MTRQLPPPNDADPDEVSIPGLGDEPDPSRDPPLPEIRPKVPVNRLTMSALVILGLGIVVPYATFFAVVAVADLSAGDMTALAVALLVPLQLFVGPAIRRIFDAGDGG